MTLTLPPTETSTENPPDQPPILVPEVTDSVQPPPEVTELITVSPEATVSPERLPETTETVEPLPEVTASVEPTPELTVEPAPEMTETVQPLPEVTASVEPTPELTVEPAPEITETVEPLPEVTASVEPAPELTVEPVPETTETVEPLPEVTQAVEPLPTPTLDIPLVLHEGVSHYQNRLPNDAAIQITVMTGNETIVDTTTTNDAGIFSVLAPSEEFFWLVVSAPLHTQYAIGVWPGEPLPEVTLMGGDLDNDGCIGTLDVALLTAQFNQVETLGADINADGLIDVADLAILAGNFDLDCGLTPLDEIPEEPVEPAPEVTESAQPLPEVTESGEPVVIETPSAAATLPPGDTLITPEATDIVATAQDSS
jgi:hypothetical protein